MRNTFSLVIILSFAFFNQHQCQAGLVVDFSPDTLGVAIAQNQTNQIGSGYAGDKFTLTGTTTIVGGSIFSGQFNGSLGDSVKFVILPDVAGVPGATAAVDVTTTISKIDTTLTTSVSFARRKHATISPHTLAAGDYWFYMTGVTTNIAQGIAPIFDDSTHWGADANADLENGTTPGDTFFTLEAVPEPSSLLLFGLVGVGGLFRRSKRGATS